ncbi:MAG: hypothetical protein GVY22_01640 [Gammaproteobacteria bacterium]|nr:hypothetical protein [Gammaproteobacteria bacterium]
MTLSSEKQSPPPADAEACCSWDATRALQTPDGARRLRYETFRDLYFAERSRRESIRSSIGIPAAGLSFALYAFIALSSRFDISLLTGHPVTIAMAGFAVAAGVALFASVWHAFRAERNFVYSEPPDLEEFLRLEREVHRRWDGNDPADLRDEVEFQTRDLLTSAYYIAYLRYVAGNTHSARQRARSLRLVFLGVLLLFLSAGLLPFHLAAAG